MIAEIPRRACSSQEEVQSKPQKQKCPKTQIKQCEETLADVLHELVSYSYLLRWLGPGADNGENLYGLGISLDRLSRRVSRTIDRLNDLKGWAAQQDSQPKVG